MRSLRNLSLKTQIVVAVCLVNLAVIVLVSYGNYHWYSTQLTDLTSDIREVEQLYQLWIFAIDQNGDFVVGLNLYFERDRDFLCADAGFQILEVRYFFMSST